MEKYMLLALKEAKKAFRKNEVPIGAVIVKDEKIISKAHNKKEKNKIVTHHAEIIAITKACKKMKNWRLNGCTIYVTVEPCMMCSGAIIQSRIDKIVYGTNNENYGFIEKNTHLFSNIKIEKDVCKKECQKIMQEFFQKKRS